MKNLDRVKSLVLKIETRVGGWKISEQDYQKLVRLNNLLNPNPTPHRYELVDEYNRKQSFRVPNPISERTTLKIQDKDFKRFRKYQEDSDNAIKNNKPVLWSAQFITCDVKRTNITRRINESLIDGEITGRELVRLYKVVGLALDDRRQLSKRLVSCGLIARSVSTRHLEVLVKTEILKVNSRIAGTKLPKLTLVAETLSISLDELCVIYKKLSDEECIDRRNKRVETMIG